MLRKIARHQFARPKQLPTHRRKFAREQFRQGRFAVAVLAQKRNPVIGIEPQAKPAQDRLAGLIANRSMLHRDKRGIGFFRFGDADGRDMLVERDAHRSQLFQHLDAALRLARFRSLGPETVHERLQMLARGFLFLGERRIEAFSSPRGLRRICHSRRNKASTCRDPDIG